VIIVGSTTFYFAPQDDVRGEIVTLRPGARMGALGWTAWSL